MEIPRSFIDGYDSSMSDAIGQLQTELKAALDTVDYSRPTDEVRREVIAIMDAYCDAASATGARISAEFYAGLRQMATGKDNILSLQTGGNPKDTERAVKAFMQQLIDGDEDAFDDLLLERLELETKKAAAYNTIDNVRNDPLNPRFARVPTGEKTCDFCLMLASRGPVYLSEESAGAFTQFHAHCDCKVVPFFDSSFNGLSRRKSKTTIEGYDPDEYYRQYQELMKNPTYEARMARASQRAKDRARERAKQR